MSGLQALSICSQHSEGLVCPDPLRPGAALPAGPGVGDCPLPPGLLPAWDSVPTVPGSMASGLGLGRSVSRWTGAKPAFGGRCCVGPFIPPFAPRVVPLCDQGGRHLPAGLGRACRLRGSGYFLCECRRWPLGTGPWVEHGANPRGASWRTPICRPRCRGRLTPEGGTWSRPQAACGRPGALNTSRTAEAENVSEPGGSPHGNKWKVPAAEDFNRSQSLVMPSMSARAPSSSVSRNRPGN